MFMWYSVCIHAWTQYRSQFTLSLPRQPRRHHLQAVPGCDLMQRLEFIPRVCLTRFFVFDFILHDFSHTHACTHPPIHAHAHTHPHTTNRIHLRKFVLLEMSAPNHSNPKPANLARTSSSHTNRIQNTQFFIFTAPPSHLASPSKFEKNWGNPFLFRTNLPQGPSLNFGYLQKGFFHVWNFLTLQHILLDIKYTCAIYYIFIHIQRPLHVLIWSFGRTLRLLVKFIYTVFATGRHGKAFLFANVYAPCSLMCAFFFCMYAFCISLSIAPIRMCIFKLRFIFVYYRY